MRIGNQDFDFSKEVYVMGILNITPDSFSDGGKYLDPSHALDRALQMQEEGVDIIDVGAESSRPGSKPLLEAEEIDRILPVLKRISSKLKVPLSVDTYKGAVARRALEEGCSLVNDITALRDPAMITTLREKKVPVILMHMKGLPETMQNQVHYTDVVGEVFAFLQTRKKQALEGGILEDKILLDPGLGFGKNFEHNVELLKNMSVFQKLRSPVVVGASRKSFIKKAIGDDFSKIVQGSVQVGFWAAQQGASLLRVHDVRETKTMIRLAKEMGFLYSEKKS